MGQFLNAIAGRSSTGLLWPCETGGSLRQMAWRRPFRAERELAPGREDDIAIYEKLYARGVLD